MLDKYKNKIPRPLNAFFLYRKAYQDRIKQIEGISNGKWISSRAGESWKEEPIVVKERYKMLARVETQKHATAFPDYRFRPKGRFLYGQSSRRRSSSILPRNWLSSAGRRSGRATSCTTQPSPVVSELSELNTDEPMCVPSPASPGGGSGHFAQGQALDEFMTAEKGDADIGSYFGMRPSYGSGYPGEEFDKEFSRWANEG